MVVFLKLMLVMLEVKKEEIYFLEYCELLCQYFYFAGEEGGGGEGEERETRAAGSKRV